MKETGLDAKKGSVTKLQLVQVRLADGHPRAGYPVDEAMCQHIMVNGMRARSGVPWRLLGRDMGKGADGVEDIAIGDGSRRWTAGVEAERRLRESAPRTAPLQWNAKDPSDLGHIYTEVELFDGDNDADFLLARLAANSEPGKLPDSVEVLAETVRQLAEAGCDDAKKIVAVMPPGVGPKEVSALSRWSRLTPAARERFVAADAPVGILSAVLDAPPAEQLAVLEALLAAGVKTKYGATLAQKKAREEKTGEPAAKARRWQPKKLVACAKAIETSAPHAVEFKADGRIVRSGFAASAEEAEAAVKMIEEAAEARGFQKALNFAAGEKTGKLARAVTAAIKSVNGSVKK